MFKTMSVSQAIIVSGVFIALAIFSIKSPVFSFHAQTGGSVFLRFNTTTGGADVCYLSNVNDEAVFECKNFKERPSDLK